MTLFWHKRNFCLAVLTVTAVCTAWTQAVAADPYRYNIIEITNTAPGNKPVIKFSVTNTATGRLADLRTDPAWTAGGGASRLFLQIGWNTSDFTNTGSGTAGGAALPIPINALGTLAVANSDGTYTVASTVAIPTTATGTGAVAMEGHPAAQDPATMLWTVRVPIKSVYKNFVITGTSIVPRRQIVDANKCMSCHRTDGTGRAPRLTLHGNNRTEEPQVCVLCHNPNQTDASFRTAADATAYPARIGSNVYPEQSIDFKRLVHGIHASAAGFRRTPLVVIGFNHSVFDASTLTRYPSNLRNCLSCHVDNGTRGTFELPLAAGVLGSTMNTRTVLGSGTFDTDPNNDVKISPTAATCSGCHDDREVISHMISTGGASFNTTQAAINSGAVRERCVNCHGRGGEKDVRRVHDDR